MLETKRRLMVGFVTLLVGAFASTGFGSHGQRPTLRSPVRLIRQNVELRREVPKTNWESSFFMALEERTKIVNLPSLRSGVHGANDLELRFWYDARPAVINGFVIRRSTDDWSAIGIRQLHERWPSQVRQEVLGPPRSGWDSLWKQLSDAGVLVLPDSDQTGCRSDVLDGGGFVLETVAKRKYRTYRYGNPRLAACDEAQRVMQIERIVADEFKLGVSKN